MGRSGPGARRSRCVRAVLIIVAAILLPGCTSSPAGSKTKPEADSSKTASITQFYARDPQLPKGEKTVLCYGVAGAKSVRLEPAVDKVWPALTRCFDIAPVTDATYTLTAIGEDGRPVSQSVTVQSVPPRPKIIEVSINSLQVHRGDQVTVCYKVKNTTSVRVVPGQLMRLGTAENACYEDWPKRTTTYIVTAIGIGGVTDTEQVTANVK